MGSYIFDMNRKREPKAATLGDPDTLVNSDVVREENLPLVFLLLQSLDST